MYYKVVKEKITFEEAIEAFKKKQIIRYKHNQPLCPSEIKNIESIGFTIEQIHSNDWSVVVADDDMEDLKRQVSNMVHEMGIDIDTRFYHEEKMDISSYWCLLIHEMFFDDKTLYEIIKWIYENGKYKSKKTNHC